MTPSRRVQVFRVRRCWCGHTGTSEREFVCSVEFSSGEEVFAVAHFPVCKMHRDVAVWSPEAIQQAFLQAMAKGERMSYTEAARRGYTQVHEAIYTGAGPLLS